MPRPRTIFALSSGAPPAGIAVIRISGPDAGGALAAMAGSVPNPRRATLRSLRHPTSGETLDTALLLWMPGPASATGEDVAEVHAHGGRATVDAILDALASLPGLGLAEAGEFTRRAVFNGRMDVAEAEGLADLLSAETQSQRQAALQQAEGGLSRQVAVWQERLVILSARVEAVLDFSDEADVETMVDADFASEIAALVAEWQSAMARPPAERLRDGIRVAIAGPPNAGKSTLMNALVQRDAAIVSDIAGTTRDIIEMPIVLDGVPFVIADSAGLHLATQDAIELLGIDKARQLIDASDILLWLGPPVTAPTHPNVLRIAAQVDRRPIRGQDGVDVELSATTGEGMDALRKKLIGKAKNLLPRPGEVALNARHRHALRMTLNTFAHVETDLVLFAEQLRISRQALSAITGVSDTEAILDALFSKFCIGK